MKFVLLRLLAIALIITSSSSFAPCANPTIFKPCCNPKLNRHPPFPPKLCERSEQRVDNSLARCLSRHCCWAWLARRWVWPWVGAALSY